MDVIAEHRLDALFPDGALAHMCLRVGRPVPLSHPEGDYVCTVQAEGLRLWQGTRDIYGVGSWHALLLGLRFLRLMLTAEAERGAVFHWEGGERAIGVDELFVLDPIE